MNKTWFAYYEEGVPTHIDYPDIPLYDMLDQSAEEYPDNTAVEMVLRYLPLGIKIASKMTYRELKVLTDRFAGNLHNIGVRPGDRVAIMLPNSPQYVIAFYGILKAGAIVVNTNPTYTARELQHQFHDAGAETVIMLSPFYQRLQEVREHTEVKRVIIADVSDTLSFPWKSLTEKTLSKEGLMVPIEPEPSLFSWNKFLEQPAPRPDVQVSGDDIALFQYTGGTTGVPKAAQLSHLNLVANTMQVAAWLTTLERGKERVMGALPFFHVYGMTVAMSLAIYTGGHLVVVPNPRPIENVMNIIQREKCTIFPGVPAMYIGVINHPDVEQYDLHSIKACISGAAPLPVEVQTSFEEITHGRLVEGYGLTEAAPVTHCNPIYGTRKAGSIGVPFPDVDAQIVDLETDEVLPVGQPGELCLRGPQVMKGYWRMPEETAQVLNEEGWLHTGDIARMDEDGFFYIVDRKKDLIIASGYNIVPREVEEVLYMYPKVQEAVVAGVPDPYRGETVKAYIVLKEGEEATADEIIAFCRQNLAPYKVPKLVEFRSELPKSLVGKFLRRVLVEEEKAKLAAQKDAEATGEQES